MEPILEISGLTKHFGGVAAVSDVSFDVPKGARFGIIGPNGAGKTTLFNMITGEFKPTNGTIAFEGRLVQGKKPHTISRMGIGRTFQITRVFDNLPVYDNIMAAVAAHDLRFTPTKAQHEWVEEVLDLTGLRKYRDVLAKNLTVAAKKRTGMATALATRPRLLLLDEAMAGLTFTEIDEALVLLRKVNSEMGITLVIVEHVMKVVMELCEEIVVLSSGQLLCKGPPHAIACNQEVIDVYLGEERRHA